MDFIYSRLNNNLVDINRIESITLLKCEHENDPIEGLEVGDYYLKVTVVDSDKVNYCDMSDLNADEQELLDKIYEEQQRAIARETDIENQSANYLTIDQDQQTGVITISLLNVHGDILDTKTLDLETEKIVRDITLDYEHKKLIFTLIDGSIIECDLDDMIDDLNQKLLVLTNNLNAEINRAKGEEQRIETKVETLVNTEQDRAEAAENLLTTNLNKEIVDRIADVNTEVLRAKEAETVLQDNINTENTRAQNEETRIENKFDAAIATEQSRAETAESDLNNRIDVEIQDRITDVDAEELRAKTAESTLDSKLDQEIQDRITDVNNEKDRAKEAERLLNTDLEEEIGRATDAEAALNIKINNLDLSPVGESGSYIKLVSQENGQLNASKEAFDTDMLNATDNNAPTTKNVKDYVDIETERATTAEGVLQDNIDDEAETRTNEIERVEGLLATEKSRAENAEDILQNNIDSEKTARISADNTLQGNINVEATTRQAVDEQLSQDISDVDIKFDDKLNYKVHIEDEEPEITYNGDVVTKTSPYRNLKTGVTGSRIEEIHLANETTAGLMSHTDYNQIRSNTSRIESIEGQTKRLLYTESENPTQTQIREFVDEYLISTGILEPGPEDYTGIAVVINNTYHIWHYYNTSGIGWKDDGVDVVTRFTNDVEGLIKGKAEDGYIDAKNDGTGSVYGWGTLKTRVSNLESSDTTINERIDSTNTALDNHKADKNNPHNVTPAQLQLEKVVNTGDSDVPLQDGTTKFTTGGAYTLQTNLNTAISNEQSRAEEAENGLSERVGTLETLVDPGSDNTLAGLVYEEL